MKAYIMCEMTQRGNSLEIYVARKRIFQVKKFKNEGGFTFFLLDEDGRIKKVAFSLDEIVDCVARAFYAKSDFREILREQLKHLYYVKN